MPEDTSLLPDDYLEVKFHTGQIANSRPVGWASEITLALYAEGKLKYFPLLRTEDDKLAFVYYPVEDMSDLVAYPTTMDQVEGAQPGVPDDMLGHVEETTARLEPLIPDPEVPVAGPEKPLEAPGEGEDK